MKSTSSPLLVVPNDKVYLLSPELEPFSMHPNNMLCSRHAATHHAGPHPMAQIILNDFSFLGEFLSDVLRQAKAACTQPIATALQQQPRASNYQNGFCLCRFNEEAPAAVVRLPRRDFDVEMIIISESNESDKISKFNNYFLL